MATDYVQETVDSGVLPIEIEYRPIRATDSGQLNGLRTVVKINSVALGTLYPEQYRVVVNRNATQCVRLAKRALNQLEEDLPLLDEKGLLPPFITVYIPTKMLMREHLQKHLKIMQNRNFAYFNRLCFEFSSDLLLEDTGEAAKRLKDISDQYGISSALSEYGDSFCPVLRVRDLPLKYVVLDETVVGKEAFDNTQMLMLIEMLLACDITVCVENVRNQEDIDAAFTASCQYYIDQKGVPVSEVSL